MITNVANGNMFPNAGAAYYNQSGPLMPALCNPFDYQLNDRPCLPQEVNLPMQLRSGRIMSATFPMVFALHLAG